MLDRVAPLHDSSGEPFLPYARQQIDDGDIAAVAGVLASDWLTTGPAVREFEDAFARYVGTPYAVAVSSGTAALHAAMFALSIQPGDEVIVPAMTFAASANCVLYQGGTPVFADVEPDTLLLDPEDVAHKVTARTRAVVAVDYAGHPCRYDELHALADKFGLRLVGDAAHALGGAYRGRPVGTLAEISTFSFHPVKHITTGEGGMLAMHEAAIAHSARLFRNHGIATDHGQRALEGTHAYDMVELGYNYRITDIQCALGLSQLRRLPEWLQRRRALAARYTDALATLPAIAPLATRLDVSHANHLYVVRLDLDRLAVGRDRIYQELRAADIGVNVHYKPVHLHSYYRRRLGTGPGLCPVAEAAYPSLLTLPLFPQMSQYDVDRVVDAITHVIDRYVA